MSLTVEQLKSAIPSLSDENSEKYLDGINQTLDKYDISSNSQIAMFLAQITHECGDFHEIVENLNYSAAGLIATWPSRFDANSASLFAHNPEHIANYVYANRMGNGGPETGDGWKYRGRGAIQITGSDEYHACAKGLGLDVDDLVEKLENDPVTIVMCAGWEWDAYKLNDPADAGDIKTVTHRINGGYIGLDDRSSRYTVALEALNNS